MKRNSENDKSRFELNNFSLKISNLDSFELKNDYRNSEKPFTGRILENKSTKIYKDSNRCFLKSKIILKS